MRQQVFHSHLLTAFLLLLIAVTVACGAEDVASSDIPTEVSPPVTLAAPSTPDLGNANLSVGVSSATPGQNVELIGEGFPAGVTVDIGIGPQNSEYDIIGETEAGANGRFTTQIELPAYAQIGESWVFVADVDNAKVIAAPIMITAPETPDPTPEEAVTEPAEGQLTRTKMFLIALEDDGQNGQKIGCNDSVIPVEIEIEATNEPLSAALSRMLGMEEKFYGQSGLYNVFHQSNLSLDGIDVESRAATVKLRGTLTLGGVCDNPRALAQLEQTILQYRAIDSTQIFLNGEPLESVLSRQ